MIQSALLALAHCQETEPHVNTLGIICRDNGKENGNYYVYHRGIQGYNIGIMEKNMETTMVYWGDRTAFQMRLQHRPALRIHVGYTGRLRAMQSSRVEPSNCRNQQYSETCLGYFSLR